ncbi:ABC transporter ATP-binding protein [Lysinibacillus sp. NPDC097195]|uniref:ABC transporter ATP-binding protein n=1 Tax=Lysinibacillus sp. NPDC097195 TaxID=3364141 RepID=UPI00381D49FE
MLKITNLQKGYGSKQILNGLELHIKKGEILGFVGSNGAGKTTTLNCITGILEPDEGTITINGVSKLEVLNYKKQFFFIPDTINIFKNISGYDWMRFVMKLYDNKQTERMKNFITQFEMEEAIHKAMGTYSYGMLHKLMLIIGFTINPPIIIMDEPLNGLDPKSVLAFKKIVQSYVEEGGTVFFSTHLLDIAEKICNAVAILKGGKIILHENVEDIVEKNTLESLFMEKQNVEY